MALAYFHPDLRYGLWQSEMNADRCHDHQQHCYSYEPHHATVRVSGVSHTKVRLACWQATAANVFTLGSSAIVIVGAVAEATGTVKSCDNGCCLQQPQAPPSGTYEMIPSTCSVASHRPSPTCDTPRSEKRGSKTGGVPTQHG